MPRGLSNNENSGKTYVSCANGVFIQRMSEATKDTIERELTKGPNAGTMVNELHFQRIEGQLVKAEKRTHEEYGTSWNFTIDVSQTPEEKEELILGVKGSYAKQILMRLPNADLKHDIVLTSYCFTPTGESKERKGISMSQGMGKVMPAYTKDEPNGLPEMTHVMLKGKKVWDDHAQVLFLEAMMDSDIIPQLRDSKPAEEAPTSAERIERFEENEEPSEQPKAAKSDKLPF